MTTTHLGVKFVFVLDITIYQKEQTLGSTKVNIAHSIFLLNAVPSQWQLC